jgi:hypothetical protein
MEEKKNTVHINLIREYLQTKTELKITVILVNFLAFRCGLQNLS